MHELCFAINWEKWFRSFKFYFKIWLISISFSTRGRFEKHLKKLCVSIWPSEKYKLWFIQKFFFVIFLEQAFVSTQYIMFTLQFFFSLYNMSVFRLEKYSEINSCCTIYREQWISLKLLIYCLTNRKSLTSTEDPTRKM